MEFSPGLHGFSIEELMIKNLFLILFFLVSLNAFGSASGDVGNTAIKNDAVTTAEILDGTIVSADISSSAGITLGQMDVSALKSADVNLSAAQLDSLNATPIAVIAAPGSGKAIMVESAMCFVDFVATRLEAGSGVLSFRYTDGSGVKATADIPNATIELNSDTHYVAAGASGVPAVNAAIVATIDADVTSGDSIINCRVFYRTVTISDI